MKKLNKLAIKLAKRTIKLADLKTQLRANISSIEEIRNCGAAMRILEEEIAGIASQIIAINNNKNAPYIAEIAAGLTEYKCVEIKKGQLSGPPQAVQPINRIPFSYVLNMFRRSNVMGVAAPVAIHSKTVDPDKINWYLDFDASKTAEYCQYKLAVNLREDKSLYLVSVPHDEQDEFAIYLQSLRRSKTEILMDLENCPTNQ